MRQVLAATGVLAAALLVGVGAYVSQADSAAAPTAGTSGSTLVLDDSDRPASTSTPSPSASPTATSDTGDDNGGRLDRDLRTEPGDDRDAQVADPDSDNRNDDNDDHDDRTDDNDDSDSD